MTITATLIPVLWLILGVGVVIASSIALYKKPGLHRNYLSYLLILTAIMTIGSLAFLNSPDEITERQDWLIGKVSLIDQASQKEADQYFLDHFIAVNNSYARALIPAQGMQTGPLSKNAVSDRKLLDSLFSFCLANPTLFDFLVCDIGFEHLTEQDQPMLQKMIQLAQMNKLLISQSSRSPNYLRLFPDSAVGRVSETPSGSKIATHTIFRVHQYSLAYRIYARLDTVQSNWHLPYLLQERVPGHFPTWTFNTFLPRMSRSDGNFHLDGAEKDHALPGITIGKTLNFFNLENLALPGGYAGFKMNLLTRQLEHKKNVLFLGAFAGDSDVHETPMGEMHGPMIIFNFVYDLHRHRHHLSFTLLFLTLGLFLITNYLTFYIAFKQVNGRKARWLLPASWRKPVQHAAQLDKHKLVKKHKPLWIYLWELMLDRVYLFVFLFLILVLARATGVLLNLIGITVFVVAIKNLIVITTNYLKTADK